MQRASKVQRGRVSAALLETGAAWGPEAQELLRAAHAPGPMQMHRMRRLFGSCACGQNCTSLDGEGDEHEEEGRDGEGVHR